jgi:Concanavalin A-like lectin/glucanases superfamily/Immunoglobulin I-set domain
VTALATGPKGLPATGGAKNRKTTMKTLLSNHQPVRRSLEGCTSAHGQAGRLAVFCRPGLFLALLAALCAPNLTRAQSLPQKVVKYQAAIRAEASLISYYTFDDRTARDTVGTGFGSLIGTTNFALGFGGGPDFALELDGLGWVDLGAVPSLNFTNGSGTLELWLKALWSEISYNPTIVASREDGVSPVNYSIHMGNAKDRIYFWNGTAAPYFLLPENAGTNWHHLGIIFDHGAWTVVWDGVKLGTGALTRTGNLDPVQLGSSNPSGTELWVGNLDEIAFYGTALDPTDIYSHFISASPPLIIEQPQDQTVTVGQSATFSVVAHGANPLAYQWQYGTNAIPGATNSEYLIPSAQFSNAGPYNVIVSNRFGTVTSAVAVLTVTPGVPPSIVIQPDSQSVAVGNSAYFGVVARGATPLSYQWWLGSNAIAGATNAGYSISSPQLSDAGPYSVIVSNSYGVVTSSIAQLTLITNFSTSVTLLPSMQSVQVGQPANFVVVLGPVTWGGTVPKQLLFTYQWRRNGRDIPGLTGAYYSIQSAQFCNAGEYSVVVTDRRGGPSITVNAVLAVNPSPDQLVAQPRNQDIVVGQPATFRVITEVGLSYQWRFGTNDIPGATGSSYTIPSVRFTDSGVYSAVESSPCYGPATTSAASLTVIPGVPPSATVQPPAQSVVVGQAASFRVDAQGSAPLRYQWRFGTNDIPGANSIVYTIDAAQPTNAGTYSVIVENAFGGTTSADVVLVVTPPGPLSVWTPVSSRTTNGLTAVASSPSMIVAVGASGTVLSSVTSKCTTSGRFKVYHPGWDWLSDFQGEDQGSRG